MSFFLSERLVRSSSLKEKHKQIPFGLRYRSPALSSGTSIRTAIVFCALAVCASLLGKAGIAASNGPTPSVLLLGEVHDNAVQHALRLEAFQKLLNTGARPALLMEQFDREHQAAIDALRATRAGIDATAVIAAGAGSSSWNWAFYRPFIDLALAHDLPIVAANVSRTEGRRVMSQGLAATGFEAAVPRDISDALSSTIEASHCGMLDAATAQRMVSVQVARDQFMARLIEANAARGVVLLAGNGHVRKDIGVPRWLSAATRAKTKSHGYLEVGDDSGSEKSGAANNAYDNVNFTAAQKRDDPCEAMRGKVPKPPTT
jgi:uncharacterized iron-regulated protein